ncbi:MAG: lipoyl synthase [Deltaproteobacteria bacterium]|nr:lipoyl synthase [Deltaproteobacteria bacterium]
MAQPRTKPPWLKVRLPGSPRYHRIKRRARALSLTTVCEEARCPNIGECWGDGTATFMVMGDTCTRGCRFCAVKSLRRPPPLDPDEPRNLARAIAEMELDYVVITSVDRDDLEDQGAAHFAACVRETRAATPGTLIEVLIPDFRGEVALVSEVVATQPDVVGHNVETVERLTSVVRDTRAGYRQSLQVLSAIKSLDPTRYSKSSLMLGVGETEDEVLDTLRDLRAVDVDFLTVGQYLQPSTRHLPVTSFVEPEVFDRIRDLGLEMGFKYVASGPLVRSSYKAGDFFLREYLDEHRATA